MEVMMDDDDRVRVERAQWRSIITEELFANVLPFWLAYSEDKDCGGFFPCLDENGDRYDDRKFMWLNGRQIWMYARICRRYTAHEIAAMSQGKLETISRATMVDSAFKAARFMYAHGVREEDGQVYFSLASDGRPYHMERKIFSACFLCMGMGVLGRLVVEESQQVDASYTAEQGEELMNQALTLFQRIVIWSHNSSALGRTTHAGAPATSVMNVPMILLNLIDELRDADVLTRLPANCDFEAEERWCVEEIIKHVNKERRMVFELVGPQGELLPGYDGRHLNPGHAIEAGWFLLKYALRNQREDLVQTAFDMVDWSFALGWDSEYQGLFYFLDAEGRSPPYLEWNMKLWWPHCEAMIALAMLYNQRKQAVHWQSFIQVAEYTLAHFSDSGKYATVNHGKGLGEWFGYCSREGQVTHRFKGGPYKGCFHVPRALFMLIDLLG